MDKYDFKVVYTFDYTSFKLSTSASLRKLIQFIEISYEDLKSMSYSLMFNQTNLKLLSPEVALSTVFQSTKTHQELLQPQANPSPSQSLLSPQIELTVLINSGNHNVFTIDCAFEGKTSSFKISSDLTFQKFKFNVLTCFPLLEQENYQIIYQKNDITNYYSNDKQLKDIFINEPSDIIRIQLVIQPKTIIEYHKRCSYCHTRKGVFICRRCSLATCEECSGQDIHNGSRDINYVALCFFKQFEQKTLEDILALLTQAKNENTQVNSGNFIGITTDKISFINRKFEEMRLLLQSIRDTQVNHLTNLIDSIINRYHPEKLEQVISDLYDAVLKYKLNPFYDCEESMRKIIEFECLFQQFSEDFRAYLKTLKLFNEKYLKCTQINKKINDMLQLSLTETQMIFKETEDVRPSEKYNAMMKVYDNSSVLVYDNDKAEFFLMNFHDDNNKFKDNFNNFIQLNYKGEKLFVITGTPCQQFFCYDLQSNEMQFISTLKFSHNWWPSMISIDEPQQGIDIFCLSGSYTLKCEMLLFNTKQQLPIGEPFEKHPKLEEKVIENKVPIEEGEAKEKVEQFNQYDSLEKPIEEGIVPSVLSKMFEWMEIQSTAAFHGQGASFIFNHECIYLLFGYDYNLSPITLIERLNVKGISSVLLSGGQSPNWETINFNNPHNISSFLYYNALLKVNDQNVLVLGGLKEINEIDVVYCYEPQSNSLLKREKKIDFLEVRFCNEKLCFKLTKEGTSQPNSPIENEYALIDGKNRIHIFKENSLEHRMIAFTPSFL